MTSFNLLSTGICLPCQFIPIIIAGFGFSPSKATLMVAPNAAVTLVAQVSCTALAFFIPNTRCLLWVLATLPALASTVMIHGRQITAQSRKTNGHI